MIFAELAQRHPGMSRTEEVFLKEQLGKEHVDLTFWVLNTEYFPTRLYSAT